MYCIPSVSEIGRVPADIIEPIQIVIGSMNWTDPETTRREKPLVDGRVRFLYTNFSKTTDYGDVFDTLFDWIIGHYPNHVFKHVEVACLRPGVKLKTHSDECWWHAICPRVHVPVVTNTTCGMDYNDTETFHLEVGKAYEIDNRTPHNAYNYGAENRIHIIADMWNRDASKRVIHPGDTYGFSKGGCGSMPKDYFSMLAKYGLVY